MKRVIYVRVRVCVWVFVYVTISVGPVGMYFYRYILIDRTNVKWKILEFS